MISESQISESLNLRRQVQIFKSPKAPISVSSLILRGPTHTDRHQKSLYKLAALLRAKNYYKGIQLCLFSWKFILPENFSAWLRHDLLIILMDKMIYILSNWQLIAAQSYKVYHLTLSTIWWWVSTNCESYNAFHVKSHTSQAAWKDAINLF